MNSRLRRLLALAGGLLAADVAAAGLYFGTGLRHAAPAWKLLLGIIWSLAVLATLFWGARWVRRGPEPIPVGPENPGRLSAADSAALRSRFIWRIGITSGVAVAITATAWDAWERSGGGAIGWLALAIELAINLLIMGICGGYAFGWLLWQFFGPAEPRPPSGA